MTSTEISEAEFAEQAQALLDGIKSAAWVPPGLSAGGSMAPLDATMRPVDALNGAGLSWLVPYVQPMQEVLDKLAGKSAVIHSFADTWQRTSSRKAV
jgi:hypothetical protein